MGVVKELFAVVLLIAPFVGIVYLIWKYFEYLRSVRLNPPKDRPHAHIWVLRVLLLIPLLIGFKIIFLPFLFVIKPEWTMGMLEAILLAGWGGFFVMSFLAFYRRFVTNEVISFGDYKEALRILKYVDEEEKVPVTRYVKEVYLKKMWKKYNELLESFFFKNRKFLFGSWNTNANVINEEIKILSKIKVRENVYYDEPYKITLKDATRHIHILAPTGSGKTKSILAPLMQQVIDKGVGIISIDPKGDTEVINSILGLMGEQGRLGDLKFLDLAFPERSHTYNPLATNNPIVCQSIINSTLPEQTGGEFYVGKQQEFINAIMSWMDTFYKIMGTEGKKFNFIDLYTIIAYLPKSIDILMAKVDSAKDRDVLSQAWIKGIQKEAQEDSRYTGFLAGLRKHIARYAFLSNAVWLINDYNPDIDVQKDLDEGRAITFFLRALKYPAGESVDIGKMLLMDIQAYASRKQEKGLSKKIPNLLFIDEAASILPKTFLRMFDMARSTGIGIAVAHQDISQFKPEVFKNIFDNSGTRVILRAGDVETAQYFSALSGEQKEYEYTYGISGYNIFDSVKEWLLPHWTSMAKETMKPVIRPDDLIDMKLGEGFVFSNVSRGNIKVTGKTYFFAKEFGSISVEQLFPVNVEKLKNWRVGGLNLIDELAYEDIKGLTEDEKEKIMHTKNLSKISDSLDFKKDQTIIAHDVIPISGGKTISALGGSSTPSYDDTEGKMVMADGNVADIDVTEH